MRFYGAKAMHVTVLKSQETPFSTTMGYVNASPSWPTTLRKDTIETREELLELVDFCLVHKKRTWAPSESGSSVSSGDSDVDSQGGYGSEDSNPVPKKNITRGNDSVYLFI
eukprot:gene22355-8876_t